MDNKDTGLLLSEKDIKLQRKWFKEMVRLIGIKVQFQSPKSNKQWDEYGQLQGTHNDPVPVFCLFEEHPTQKTAKKMGWIHELQENSSLIQVPYDLEGVQDGALFRLPAAIDEAEGRLFRVISMESIAVYPAYITCELAPVFKNKFEKSQLSHTHSSFNLLNDEEEGM